MSKLRGRRQSLDKCKGHIRSGQVYNANANEPVMLSGLVWSFGLIGSSAGLGMLGFGRLCPRSVREKSLH
jgi:hypothetical protein